MLSTKDIQMDVDRIPTQMLSKIDKLSLRKTVILVIKVYTEKNRLIVPTKRI